MGTASEELITHCSGARGYSLGGHMMRRQAGSLGKLTLKAGAEWLVDHKQSQDTGGWADIHTETNVF